MSATLSARSDSNSRNWWSLPSKSASSNGSNKLAKEPRRSVTEKSRPRAASKSSSGLRLNSIAYAIGFKSKKQPSLAIQEPPQRPIIIPPIKPSSAQFTNRPPSKSVSSTLRTEDSVGPKTPSDAQKDPLSLRRQSLFTLSDDPFAAQSIILPPDATRLSPHDRGKQDFSPHVDDRSSYASTSSQSPLDNKDSTAISSWDETWKDKGMSMRSRCNSAPKTRILPSETCLSPGDEKPRSAEGLPRTQISKSISSSTLTDRNHNPSDPRPPSRPRVMTSPSGSQPKLEITPQQPTPSPRPSPTLETTPPRAILRKASASRISLPSAPPPEDLPPPPPHDLGLDYFVSEPNSPASASSSRLSFASSVTSNREMHVNRSRNAHFTERDTFSTIIDSDWIREFIPASLQHSRTDSMTQTLKKAASHQSLIKKAPVASSSSTPPATAERSKPTKPLRKQRSFNPQRGSNQQILSLRSATFTPPSFAASASQMDEFVPSDRSMSGSRKRLFSGSSIRRPTTSPLSMVEDDIRSLSSMRPERERSDSFASFMSSPLISSFWDEEGTSPCGPSGREYTPQHIMSPAEMLKLEAKVQAESEENAGRSRGMSFHSMSTMGSMTSESECISDRFPPLSPSHSIASAAAQISAAPSHGTRVLPQLPRLMTRPNTSQGNMTPPGSPEDPSSRMSSFSPRSATVALSPSPRPRTQPSPQISNRSSFILTPLSPPPMRRALRAMPSVEPVIQKRLIIRKPSFLDIGDDPGEDLDEPIADSFLNLDRESFDTVRTTEDPMCLF